VPQYCEHRFFRFNIKNAEDPKKTVKAQQGRQGIILIQDFRQVTSIAETSFGKLNGV
jgi:hypothetical protein